MPPGGDRVLRALLEARASFLVSGGTGSGKTTLLSACLGLVGPDERIVLAEDSTELRPDHPHVVRLEARPANEEGAGLVTLEDLVRQALRMRPDRLVVGEVRGPEVVHLLAALNTGHEGCSGTVHANAATDVPARLEVLGTAAGLDRSALHRQVAAAWSRGAAPGAGPERRMADRRGAHGGGAGRLRAGADGTRAAIGGRSPRCGDVSGGADGPADDGFVHGGVGRGAGRCW
ncbi:hypothetical protein SFUMM280S_03012 [Streptomyces fumanus]